MSVKPAAVLAQVEGGPYGEWDPAAEEFASGDDLVDAALWLARTWGVEVRPMFLALQDAILARRPSLVDQLAEALEADL